VFGALVNVSPHLGYPVVFILIALETMGIPLPGETALITAALAASQGNLEIEIVIGLAAAAAIIGDNVGFMIGRRFGRRVFEKPGWGYRQRQMLLAVGEPFFAKHGPKAVFLGRWVAGLRIASSWLAGMNNMRWPTFLFWNALGGICWALTVGLGAYFAGHAFANVIHTVGLGAAAVVGAAGIGVAIWWSRREKRHFRERAEQELARRPAHESE
jgi:membrane protein DedA with SNARE-associated domain